MSVQKDKKNIVFYSELNLALIYALIKIGYKKINNFNLTSHLKSNLELLIYQNSSIYDSKTHTAVSDSGGHTANKKNAWRFGGTFVILL